MKILISAGGTGGHIYPGLSIAQKIRERHPDWQIRFVGSHVGMEKKIVPQYGFEMSLIRARGFERGFSKETLEAIKGIFDARKDAKKLLKNYKPDLVITTGGFTGAMLLEKAQKMHIPTMIHEQNAYAGRSNRLTGKNANRVAVCFDEARQYFPEGVTFLCGNPVREAFLGADREKSREYLDLKDEKLILVTGGSQGAMSINAAAVDALKAFEEDQKLNLKWIFLVGRGNEKSVTQMVLDKIGYVPDHVSILGYSEEMDILQSAADLAISRAGAMSVSELSVLEVPSILIPYPYAAGDHQTFNAKVLEKAGAAKMIADDKLSLDTLYPLMNEILSDDAAIHAMREACRRIKITDAADRFVDEAEKLIKE